MLAGIFTDSIGLLVRILRSVRAEARSRRAERQLHELDDRMLQDMGLRREQIGGIVRASGTGGPLSPARPAVQLEVARWQENRPPSRAA